MRIVLSLLLSFLLGGCAALGVPGIQSPELAKVTRSDLDAAIAISTAGGDKIAANCFTVLRDYLTPTTAPTTTLPAVQGVFSALAAVRNARRAVDRGVPENVHVACSPLVVDSQLVIVRLLSPLR